MTKPLLNLLGQYSLEKKSLYSFVNPFAYKVLMENEHKEEILSTFQFYMDGISLVEVAKLKLNRHDISRISFDDTSLAPIVFDYISQNNLKLGIIGSSELTIQKAKELILQKYKNISILSQNGFFSKEEKTVVLTKFLDCDFVICSMGTPLQELTLIELRKLGWEGIGFTCGGYFDQLVSAKGNNYYPFLLNKLNLRWLYRIFKEPKRLWKRYFWIYPLGAIHFLLNKNLIIK